MTITTRDFGTLELDENEIVTFRTPIYGFEWLTRYVLLSDDEAGAGLMWLQSTESPDVCFVLLDPEEIGLAYAPELPAEALATLGAQDGLAIRLVAVIPDDFRNATVNLKSPIVINPQNKTAAQVILEADFPIRMRLFDEEGTPC